jgi:hypothetical protein
MHQVLLPWRCVVACSSKSPSPFGNHLHCGGSSTLGVGILGMCRPALHCSCRHRCCCTFCCWLDLSLLYAQGAPTRVFDWPKNPRRWPICDNKAKYSAGLKTPAYLNAQGAPQACLQLLYAAISTRYPPTAKACLIIPIDLGCHCEGWCAVQGCCVGELQCRCTQHCVATD